jgi:acyl carrier protein
MNPIAAAGEGPVRAALPVVHQERGDATGSASEMDFKAIVRPFILGNFLFTDDAGAVADDASLIRGGIVDSTGILELIEFLEATCGIRVAAEEMVPANFDSIDTISAFLQRKAACSPP